jgi:hypothetical protein
VSDRSHKVEGVIRTFGSIQAEASSAETDEVIEVSRLLCANIRRVRCEASGDYKSSRLVAHEEQEGRTRANHPVRTARRWWRLSSSRPGRHRRSGGNPCW